MNVIKFFIQLTLFILLPGMIFTLVASRTPMLGGIRSFVVLSGSMEPTLPVGGLIYVTKSSGYKPGDVISFKVADDEVVTHRIIDIVKKDGAAMYRTQGDANNILDAAPVAEDKIIGRNIFTIPFIGYLFNFLKTPLGFVSTVIFPTTVFIVFEIWNLKKEIEKHVEKKIMEKLKQAQLSS